MVITFLYYSLCCVVKSKVKKKCKKEIENQNDNMRAAIQRGKSALYFVLMCRSFDRYCPIL